MDGPGSQVLANARGPQEQDVAATHRGAMYFATGAPRGRAHAEHAGHRTRVCDLRRMGDALLQMQHHAACECEYHAAAQAFVRKKRLRAQIATIGAQRRTTRRSPQNPAPPVRPA